MLKIRLTRHGAKQKPFYHIIVADVKSPQNGRFIEKLGTYNPNLQNTDEKRIQLNKERIQYWLSVGAKPTDRVHRFLANASMAIPVVFHPQTKKDKPSQKTLDKIQKRQEKQEKTKPDTVTADTATTE